jgi:cytoskeleton protein RodZ
MSESDNSEAGTHEPAAFGQQLMLAREKAGMSIEETARALNLKQEIVEAIEESALDKLPPVTFVQGYIRSYARLLGLSEERLLREFEEEVPHELESELVPRPPSPDGANSQTPIIKLITGLVFVLALLILVFAVYKYLSERTEHIEQASLAGSEDAMMQPPAQEPAPEQLADLVEPVDPVDPVDDVAAPDTAAAEEVTAASMPGQELPAVAESEPLPDTSAESLPEHEVAEEVVEEVATETAAAVAVEEIMPVPEPKPITGGDEMVLRADEESWAEIIDANDIRLFYGMIRPGRELSLVGQAPFDVFLGNAPVVSLQLNSITIDMTKYIRSNNIAQFKISVEDGRARFQ